MNDSVLNEIPIIHSEKTVGKSTERSTFEHTLCSLFPAIAVTSNGTIKHLTGSAKLLLGYRHEQSITSSLFSMIHDRNVRQVMLDIADMVTNGKIQASWFFRLRTGQDNWQWFRAVAHNHLDTPENIITIILREF